MVVRAARNNFPSNIAPCYPLPMRLALLLAASLLAVPAFAQIPSTQIPSTQIPSTQIDPPPQSNIPADAPLNPKLPTLFIVGDSTARNGANLGWGDHLANYFDTTKINIANRARAGRSSRTYINEGLWAKTLAEMKPGDTMLLQMGHNDGGDLGGAKPRGEIKGIGDESQAVPQTAGPLAGTTETVHTYGWYVRKYVAEARAKGVTPVFLTITIRNIWKDGSDGKKHIERDMGYTAYLYQLSEELQVPIADMATLEADSLESLGPEKTALLFPIDHTHTSAVGAEINAQMVAAALRNSHVSVAKFLNP